MPKTSTRKDRRKEAKSNYLTRKSYTHGSTLNSSLEADTERPETSAARERVCVKCRLILSHYTDIFKGLIHQGSELKRRKHLNPHPKRPDAVHYRNLKMTGCVKTSSIPCFAALVFVHHWEFQDRE